MREFQEQHAVRVALMSTGSTTEQFTPYYDMAKYRRVDFLVAGLVQQPASGALGATDFQMFQVRAMQASDSTGGGATGISSATAVAGKDSATGVSTASKMREGRINFSTIASAVNAQVVVGTAAYTSGSAAAANVFAIAGATAQATVASEGFVSMFNGTNNTHSAITSKWVAATMAGPWVRILPKDPDGTDLLTLGTTGSSQIGVGGVFEVHLGVDRQYLKDGMRYVSLGIKSTEHANPYTVTVIRTVDQGPAVNVTLSKSINQSTSK